MSLEFYRHPLEMFNIDQYNQICQLAIIQIILMIIAGFKTQLLVIFKVIKNYNLEIKGLKDRHIICKSL